MKELVILRDCGGECAVPVLQPWYLWLQISGFWVEVGCGWSAGYGCDAACPSTASYLVWMGRVLCTTARCPTVRSLLGRSSQNFNRTFPSILLQKNEWLCLNCQTQRLLEGSLGDPAPMPLPTPKPPSTGSPRHQPPATGQQRAPTPAPVPTEPAAPPEQQPSPARSLRAAEQSRTPSPAPAEKKPQPPAEKKPPVLAEEKPLPKAAPEPSKAPEGVAPKGKSMTPKPEVESKESKAPPEAPRVKEQEVSSQGASSSRHPWAPNPAPRLVWY